MPSEPRLRDQLCELEPQNPLLRERYTQEIRAMFEKKVTSSMKGVLGAVGLGSVGIAAWLGWHAVVRDELPGLARVGLAGGALFSAGWAYLCGRALRRGVWELWVQPGATATLAWGAAVLLETCFLVLAPQFPDHFNALVALFSGLVILVGAGVMIVTASVQQAQLRTQEGLLRLEYQIAQMSENRSRD